jgi:phosphoserine phosphatase RsbU/P
MAYLIVENGPEPGTRYDLTGEQATIGRHPDCEIALKESGRISRYHAQIQRKGEEYTVKDLRSRNGTLLNGKPISDQPHPLRDGDRVSVCDASFVFHDAPPARPSAKTAAILGTVDALSGWNTADAQLVDDGVEVSSSSTIMSKVGISSNREGSVQLSSSIEARMAALIEITRSLGKALSLDKVLPQVLNSLFKIFLQADRGFIVLKTESGELAPRWTKFRNERRDDTIRISRTIVKHVMESREAILSADATRDERLDLSQSLADLRIRSMMCAPLLDSEGTPLGVIQVDTLDQRKRFRHEDLEVLASVAVQAGFAIDNAQLHEGALRQKEIEHDLELAREVQQGLLPQTHPQLEGYEFFDYYQAAHQVGGDYYDYIALPDGRTAVVVADVVGHGVAAAMMMAKLSAEAKYCLAAEARPALALTRLNERLSTMQVDRFVTLVMVVLDPVRHEATIANAGHMAPVWRRVDGSIEEPGASVSGLPIGVREGYAYEQTAIALQPGESLTLYTDGINEAVNARGEQYTIERIRRQLRVPGARLQTIGEAIVADVRQFLGNQPQSDDMCLVCFSRVG